MNIANFIQSSHVSTMNLGNCYVDSPGNHDVNNNSLLEEHSCHQNTYNHNQLISSKRVTYLLNKFINFNFLKYNGIYQNAIWPTWGSKPFSSKTRLGHPFLSQLQQQDWYFNGQLFMLEFSRYTCNLDYLMLSQPEAGVWNWRGFKVPSSPDHSIILWSPKSAHKCREGQKSPFPLP